MTLLYNFTGITMNTIMKGNIAVKITETIIIHIDKRRSWKWLIFEDLMADIVNKCNRIRKLDNEEGQGSCDIDLYKLKELHASSYKTWIPTKSQKFKYNAN